MRRTLRIIIIFILSLVISCFIFYGVAKLIPLNLDEKAEKITILDRHQNIIYESNFNRSSTWTPLTNYPKLLQEIVISIEDRRFYSHIGFDPLRLSKALFNNLKSMSIVEGGSTITQQTAKNLFLSNDQTLQRKIIELFYAAQLEMQYSKEEILEGYLNTVYFGHGIYGFHDASLYFFNKNLKDCSLAQYTMLAAIPNGPSLYSPFIDREQAKKRQHLLLDQLTFLKVISPSTANQAKSEPLQLGQQNKESTASHYAIQAILDEYHALNIETSSGLTLVTSFDPDIQKTFVHAFQAHQSSDECENSGIILEPYTGNILALQGGKDYTISQYIRPLYAKRQVASTIKPLLYYNALLAGFTPSTTFLSAPTTFQISEEETYAPTNYNQFYPFREISMINAIALSDNIYAIKTHLFLGEQILADSLHAFHIEAKAYPSLALGAQEMTLLQITSIYNTFASTGYYTPPSFIQSIHNNHGQIVYEKENTPKKLLNSDLTLILNQMLTATYDPKNRTFAYPTMYGSQPQVPVSIKSGTSDMDSLVIGYNPDYTIAVWSGFDDGRPLDKSYYHFSKEIFKDTFNALYEKETTYPWYQKSPNIVSKVVDPISGKESLLGSVYWYLK